LARALSALSETENVEVVHLFDKFARNTADEVWLKELSSDKTWVIFSGDYRITRTPQTRIAWQEAGLTTFFLQRGWNNLPFWEQAWKVVKWWPTILETARTIKVGTSFLVPVKGSKLEIV
jgi:hypothetical protein